MASEFAMESASARDKISMPYPAGWVNRLIRWIDGLPGPSSLFYLIALAVQFFILNAVRWADHSLALGAFDVANSFGVVYDVSILAAVHYLDIAAAGAFDHFRPALGLSEVEQVRLKYELATLPSRETIIATVLGFGVTAVELTARSTYRGWYSNAFMVVDIVLSASSFALASILFYHTFHQLRLASQIQRLATRLDLFQFEPLYAFSGLTARTGLVLIFLVSLSVIGNPNALENPILLALHALGLVLATACFVLPLYGMHQRILEEKKHLLGEANKYLQAAIAELHGEVQERDWSHTEALNNIMAGLVIEREVISKIPTWPWQPGTFTGFVTALSLPIVIFLIQTALKRFLNL